MQGVERYVLQRRHNVRSIRYDHVGAGLREVTVRYGLIECVVREARERDDITLGRSAMNLEIQDHIMSGYTELKYELVIAAAANQAVIAGTTNEDVVAGSAVESESHRSSG